MEQNNTANDNGAQSNDRVQSDNGVQSKDCKPSVSKTIRHEIIHLIAALVLTIFITAYYQNGLLGFWTFGLSMFLDGDHLFDYLLYLVKYNKDFSFKEFLSGAYFKEWKKFITPLHSWELVAILAVLYFIFGNPFFIASSLALGIHYFVDYFTNNVNKKAYFILYRASRWFQKTAIRKNA